MLLTGPKGVLYLSSACMFTAGKKKEIFFFKQICIWRVIIRTFKYSKLFKKIRNLSKFERYLHRLYVANWDHNTWEPLMSAGERMRNWQL